MGLSVPKYYKNERKEKIKLSILFIGAFLLVFIIGGYLFNHFRNIEEQKAEGIFTICNLDYKDTLALIHKDEYEHVYEISDYLYYGENLNLFNKPYDITKRDDIIGRTLILTNMCTKAEMVYLIDGNIDNQIPIEVLEDGFYSVKIVYDLTQRSAYSETKIDDIYYTVRRNGQSKQIRLIADAEFFSNDQQQESLDRNYLFIEVKSETVPDTIYDIVIDPGHSSKDTGNYVEYGGRANGLLEADETYKLAMVIKDELESYGLKVLVTRSDPTEVVDTYGEDGRLDRAYKAKAKYYIDLQMRVASNPNIEGTQIVHSSFTSSKMANAIYSYLLDNTDLVSTGYRGSGRIPGVIASGKINGYDGRMVIRESGGRLLAAGTFSDLAQELNASFAKDERYGIQAFTIEYIYISNPTEVEKWKASYQDYGIKTAEGIALYLNIID